MSFSIDVIEKIAALVTAAFGLIAALAWNTAIQEIFTTVFGETSTIPAMLGYAVLVTVIAVLATIWVGVVSNKAKKTTEKISSKLHSEEKKE